MCSQWHAIIPGMGGKCNDLAYSIMSIYRPKIMFGIIIAGPSVEVRTLSAEQGSFFSHSDFCGNLSMHGSGTLRSIARGLRAGWAVEMLQRESASLVCPRGVSVSVSGLCSPGGLDSEGILDAEMLWRLLMPERKSRRP